MEEQRRDGRMNRADAADGQPRSLSIVPQSTHVRRGVLDSENSASSTGVS